MVRRFISTIGYRPSVQPSVLILSDDTARGAALAAILQAAKLRTRAAPHARLERMIAAEEPELVVVEGNEAAALCTTLAQTQPALPVVAITSAADKLAVLRTGVEHWLAAPADPEELVVRATLAIERAGRHRAAGAKLESLRLWHDWVRYLVHDLRSPVQVAMVELAFPDHSEEHIARARAALDTVAGMLRDLLDTDRIRHGVLVPRRQEIDVADLARAVVAKLPLEHRVEIASEGDTQIAIDPALVGRVFENLITNADRHAREAPVQIEVSGTAHGVSVHVVNDGEGVAPEIEPALFEPWHNIEAGAQRGTGLGLAFCRLVCEAHQGQIWLENGAAGAVAFAFGIPRPPRIDA